MQYFQFVMLFLYHITGLIRTKKGITENIFRQIISILNLTLKIILID